MSTLEFPVGATQVPIELVLNDADGGVAGDTPTVRIRRISDNTYLDFADNKFKTSGWTQVNMTLSDRGDGRYYRLWNSSLSITVPTVVIIEYTNATTLTTVPGVDNDIVVFSNSVNILQSLAHTPLANVGDGPGGCRFVYTLTLVGTTTPIVDAMVYVTTDPSGVNIIAGPKNTDSNGKVIFYLNSGTTYYLWRSKGGVTFSNPDIEIIA